MEHKDRMGRGLQVRKVKKRFRFPTLFSKLFTLYISILIGMLIFFFVTFTEVFTNYFVGYTQNMMIRQAQLIEREYRELAKFNQSVSGAAEKMLFKIEVLDSYLDATTWLVDKNNTFVVVSSYEQQEMFDRRVLAGQAIRAIEQVFNGDTIRIESGFEEYFYSPVLTIGYPISVYDEVEYALFIHTPMPQILETIQEVRTIILRVVGVTSILVFIAIYIISKQMTKPLKEMNNIAKKVANGEFDKRIKVEGEDEIAQLAQSLNYMARELDKIEEGRKSFIANVSHDMRSPLTSIQGFITAILDGTIPPELHQKYLNIVLSESHRLIKMANDILELNKMEEGTLPLKKTTFDLHEMIKDLLTNFENITVEKRVDVRLILDSKEQYVFADPEKVVRVLQNLIDNAFKFVGVDGVIEIETVTTQDKVWVYIKNDGPEISEEDQKNIWERFYKADRSRGKDKNGMGIGLVIVKEIIKQHDQQIGIMSEPGEMVQFYFTLEKSQDSHK